MRPFGSSNGRATKPRATKQQRFSWAWMTNPQGEKQKYKRGCSMGVVEWCPRYWYIALLIIKLAEWVRQPSFFKILNEE
jgi:hypothetical protein